MVKHIIKGKTCEVEINIPKYWDENTKNVLTQLMKYCLPPERQEEVIASVNTLVYLENLLIDALKAVGYKQEEYEKFVREFIGISLNHGFELGANYTLEATEKMEMLRQQVDFKKEIDKVPKDDAKLIVILYSIYLGRLAYETGFLVGTYISKDMVEQYRHELEEKMSYVG